MDDRFSIPADRPSFWRLSVDAVWVRLDRLLLGLGGLLLGLGTLLLWWLLYGLLWWLLTGGVSRLLGLLHVLAL